MAKRTHRERMTLTAFRADCASARRERRLRALYPEVRGRVWVTARDGVGVGLCAAAGCKSLRQWLRSVETLAGACKGGSMHDGRS